MDERSVKIDCEDFTREKYLQIINQRITIGLESIGLDVTSISKTDEETYVIALCRGVGIENYRLYLQELIGFAIAPKHTIYNIDQIEKYTLETIRTISLKR